MLMGPKPCVTVESYFVKPNLTLTAARQWWQAVR